MKKLSLIFTLVAIVVMSACDKEDVLPQIENVEIGDTYEGGTVGAIYDDGSILIVSDPLVDNNGNNVFIWGTSPLVTDAGHPSDGRSNTDKIMSVETSTENFAAKMCVDYRGGNFDDWYLPARIELEKILATGVIKTRQWSSTEPSKSTTRALPVPSYDLTEARDIYHQKQAKHPVRAVRRVN